jgi:hypothetical protein
MDPLRQQAEREARRREEIFDRLRALRNADPPPAPQQEADLRLRLQVQQLEAERLRLQVQVQVEAQAAMLRAGMVFPREEVDPDDWDGPPARPVVTLPIETFDRLVLDPTGVNSTQLRLQRGLDAELSQIRRNRRLTDDQVEKLRLAGRGDIQRLFHQYEQLRWEFRGVQGDLTRASVLLLRKAQPLRRAFQMGPFGEGSLLRKTLAGFGPEECAPATSPPQ